jgi:serine/threonine-protein kinase
MSSTSSVLLASRYRLDDRIAAGGFGEVWRATDVLLARPVAVKLLHPGYVGHAETLARFQAEARHAGALCHEHIALVYDYGEPDPPQPPFLVLELVEGPSLAAVLTGGPLPPARAMDIIAQAAAGLDAAHRAGVVHRDIKPGNLLLSGGNRVKITDFGISHAVGSEPLTGTGLLIGTAGYLAPEQIAGARATPASDLYSLGVLAYECLTGSAPFSGPQLEVALAHRDRPLPALPATVPADVAALVGHLTAKDPAARPGSAEEVAREAARLRDRLGTGAGTHLGDWPAAPEPAPAWNPTLSLAAGRGPRRGDRIRAGRVAGIAAAVLAVVLTGLVLTTALGATHRPQAGLPSSGSKPSLSTADLVQVKAGSLIGHPVGAVTGRLHQLGLVVRVQWQRSGAQPPGSVVSVLPSGWVRRGSVVTVIGVLRPAGRNEKPKPPGNGHGKAHGHGKGKGASAAATPVSSPSATPSSPAAPGTQPGTSPPATPSAAPASAPAPTPTPTASTEGGSLFMLASAAGTGCRCRLASTG